MNNVIRKFAPLIALAAAVVFLIMGISGIRQHNSFAKTTGTITRIETIEAVSADENDDHVVYVSYTVDGKDYESQLGEYSASMSEGKSIEIQYNTENPAEIISASYFGVIMYFVLSALGFIGGVAALIKRIR